MVRFTFFSVSRIFGFVKSIIIVVTFVVIITTQQLTLFDYDRLC